MHSIVAWTKNEWRNRQMWCNGEKLSWNGREVWDWERKIEREKEKEKEREKGEDKERQRKKIEEERERERERDIRSTWREREEPAHVSHYINRSSVIFCMRYMVRGIVLFMLHWRMMPFHSISRFLSLSPRPTFSPSPPSLSLSSYRFFTRPCNCAKCHLVYNALRAVIWRICVCVCVCVYLWWIWMQWSNSKIQNRY